MSSLSTTRLADTKDHDDPVPRFYKRIAPDERSITTSGSYSRNHSMPDLSDEEDVDDSSFQNAMNRDNSIPALIEKHGGITRTGIGSNACNEGQLEEEEEEVEQSAQTINIPPPLIDVSELGLDIMDESDEEDSEETRDQVGFMESSTFMSAADQVRQGLNEEEGKGLVLPFRKRNSRRSFTASRFRKSIKVQTNQRRESSVMLSIAQSQEKLEALDSKNKRFENLQAYFFNNGMSIAIGALFFAMNIVVGAHAAYQFTERGGFTTDSDILRVTQPIARAGGRMVTFNCAWMLITACKYLWTMVRSHVVPIIPIGFPIDDIMPKYHRMIALWIIFCGCIIHSLPQILNYAVGAIKIDNGNRIWTFGNGLATRQLLITGVLLMSIFAMLFLTTFKSFRETTAGFRWFWCFHMAGIALSYPLLIVHGTFRGHPVFLICALSPLLLYAFDLLMRNSKVKNTKILEWKTHENNGQKIVELVVQCPPDFVYTPGQYAEIKYDPISTNEWHPFTIASAPNNDIRVYNGKRVRVLVFFVKATGRWTGSLYETASTFDLIKSRRRNISIRGPYGSPASNFFEYKHIIVIGSGVGVTPLLSVWQYMMAREHSEDQHDDLLVDTLSKRMVPSSSKENLVDIAYSTPSSSDTFVVDDEETSRFRLACSKAQDFLESLIVSMFLFCFFLILETIIAVMVIFGYYGKVALFESILVPVSLVIHMGTIIASACADGGIKYFLLFKCWIEVGILLVDALNMWLSISFLEVQDVETDNESYRSARAILALGAMSVFLHAIRIFHIFYTTLKPQQNGDEMTPESKGKKEVSSIKGIFINPQYSGMKYCFDTLLKPMNEAVSTVFKLQFFGTRETTSEIRSSIFSEVSGGSSELVRSMNSSQCPYSFQTGRPDFEYEFQKEINNVKRSNPTSEEISIGVFFCGSPAIAKSICSAATKVNAYHQRLASRDSSSKKNCSCKIVVHVESY